MELSTIRCETENGLSVTGTLELSCIASRDWTGTAIEKTPADIIKRI